MSKSYNLDCPVARTLDVIGERWTALILRDLFLGRPGRFQGLQESLGGVAPNVLSDRLKSLESAGIINRRAYSDHPPRFEYALTDKGRSLGPIMKALREWGLRNTS